MLDLNRSELIETRTAYLSSSVTLLDEGVAMVQVLEGGVAKVKPATGAANEIFVGFSHGRQSSPLVAAYIEQLTVPASSPYTVTLSKQMSGSNIGVAIVAADGTQTALAAGTPGSNATDYSISGGVVTLNSAQAGKTVQVSYRYAPTAIEAQLRYSFDAFAPAFISIDTTGLITTGTVYTDAFDPTANWAGFTGASVLKTLANGVVTIGGSGTTLAGVVVEQIPGIDSPMLALRMI